MEEAVADIDQRVLIEGSVPPGPVSAPRGPGVVGRGVLALGLSFGHRGAFGRRSAPRAAGPRPGPASLRSHSRARSAAGPGGALSGPQNGPGAALLGWDAAPEAAPRP